MGAPSNVTLVLDAGFRNRHLTAMHRGVHLYLACGGINDAERYGRKQQ
jgi:hypothetical protein